VALIETLIPILSSVTALGGLASGARVVQEGQRGMKLRFGKVVRHKAGSRKGNPKVVKPGFVFLIPGVDSLRKVHVRASTLNLDTQSIMLKDRTVFNVGAMVIVRVRDTDDDVYRALFETFNLHGSVRDYCAAELRDVLTGMTYTDMADPESLARQVHARVEGKLTGWGLRVEEFMLTDCSPTPATARLVLMGTEVEFRTEALRSAAAAMASDPNIRRVHPTIAAALVGTPVGVQLGGDKPLVDEANGKAPEK
jgi:regulator of protease activity HflC (stomatin/prohibitin superfamily)